MTETTINPIKENSPISEIMAVNVDKTGSQVKFYYMPESPPCRTVEMVAELAGVKLDKQYVNLAKQEHLKPEYLQINPIGTIPFIIDGDVKIGESRAIACYLVNKYMPSDNTLYPHDPSERAKVDELLYLDIGYVYAATTKYFSPRIFGKAKEFDQEAGEKLAKSFEYLDKRLENNGGRKFLLGDELTLADVSFAASLSFPEACGYDLTKFTHLHAYHERLKESIPKYHEINDKANQNMKIYISEKLANKA